MSADLQANGLPRLTVESIFTSDWGCGMYTATPAQIAICRLLDRAPLGDLADHPEVIKVFGGRLPDGIELQLDSLMVVAGIRSAKSMMMSANAIKIARTCELGPSIKPSDSLRVPIVSPKMDTSKATFKHVLGILQNSTVLRDLIVGKPTSDSVTIEHESGRPIEIKVVALSEYGSTLVGRWIPGIIFDEIFLMGSGEYVKNLTDARDAVHGRVMRGGMEMMIGSAKGSIGPAFRLYEENFGKPSSDLVVCKAEGPLMNPMDYSPENCAKLLRKNERAYRENVLCIFSDPEEAFVTRAEVVAAFRGDDQNVPPQPGWSYVAAMDPATRGNAWAFGIIGGRPDGGLSLSYRKEWRPKRGEPLSPKAVLTEQAAEYKRYGCEYLVTDQNMAEALSDIAYDLGMVLIIEDLTSSNRLKMAEDFIALLRGDLFDLPRDEQIASDIQWVKRKVSPNGNASLHIPETEDGRHCDYFPMLMMGTKWRPNAPEVPEALREPEPLDDWAANQETPHGRYNRALRRVAG